MLSDAIKLYDAFRACCYFSMFQKKTFLLSIHPQFSFFIFCIFSFFQVFTNQCCKAYIKLTTYALKSIYLSYRDTYPIYYC